MIRWSALPDAVRVIMFDLDGTLIDTMGAFADVAATAMVERHGMEFAAARRRYLATSGIPFRQQLELIAPGHPENDAASDWFETAKRAAADSANMDARTLAGLERMRAAGVRIVVSSNSAQHFVDEFAARQSFRFDLVLGFDRDGFAKGPPHVARTCEVLGVTPADIVFCGDSLKDGELARESGVAFVGRLGTFTREDFHAWEASAQVIDDAHALAEMIVARAAA